MREVMRNRLVWPKLLRDKHLIQTTFLVNLPPSLIFDTFQKKQTKLM